MSELVKLLAVSDEVEGQRLRRELLVAGIPSFLQNTDMLSTIHMLPPPPFSLWLYVRDVDAAEAAELLGIELDGPEG